MLYILVIPILVLILLITSLLLIRLNIQLIYAKKGDEINGKIKILLFKKIKIYTKSYPTNNNTKEKNRDIKKLLKLAKPCLNDLINFLIKALKTSIIIKIENHIIFGKESYADTGKYIGIIWAILAQINSINEKIKISAQPTFTGETLDANGINEIEIRLIRIVMPLIRLISKKKVRKFIKGVINDQ